MLRRRAGDEILGVAGEMDPASLPRGPEELLADGLHEAAVVVADDETDAGQAALDEPSDEWRPGAALVVARRRARDRGPGARRCARPRPRRGRPSSTTRPPSRTLTYVASSQRYGYARRRASGSGTPRPRRRGRRRSGSPRSGSSRRSRGPRRDPRPGGCRRRRRTPPGRPRGGPARPAGAGSSRLGKYEPSRTRGIARPIVPTRVSQRRSRYPFRFVRRRSGCALALGGAGELGDLGLHHRLGEHPDALAQEVDVSLGDRLAHRVEHGHPVLGHRGLPLVVGSSVQRREDDAMAALGQPVRLLHQSGTQPRVGGSRDRGLGCRRLATAPATRSGDRRPRDVAPPLCCS